MKRLLLFGIVLLFACSKDSGTSPSNEACYVCTHSTTIKTGNTGSTESSTTTACNLTPDEAKNLETTGTHTTTEGEKVTIVVTTCLKQ